MDTLVQQGNHIGTIEWGGVVSSRGDGILQMSQRTLDRCFLAFP